MAEVVLHYGAYHRVCEVVMGIDWTRNDGPSVAYRSTDKTIYLYVPLIFEKKDETPFWYPSSIPSLGEAAQMVLLHWGVQKC